LGTPGDVLNRAQYNKEGDQNKNVRVADLRAVTSSLGDVIVEKKRSRKVQENATYISGGEEMT